MAWKWKQKRNSDKLWEKLVFLPFVQKEICALERELYLSAVRDTFTKGIIKR